MSSGPGNRYRCSMLVRALKLVRLLSVRRLTLSEMAEHVGVHERTIRRDLAAMEEAHLPLIKTETGHYRLLQEQAL